MARKYCILHHRQLGGTSGHWDLVENPIPFRSSHAGTAQGDGTLCAALETLAADGWTPVMALQQGQPGETFILIARDGA